MAKSKKINVDSEVVEAEVLTTTVAEDVVSPKLVTETVVVQKDENGLGGKTINGIVSSDRKSVTTLEGVTFAL